MSVANSVVRLVPFWKEKNVQEALDYGAGTLRHALYLIEKGFGVYVVDTPRQVANILARPERRKLRGLFDTNQIGQIRLGVDLVIANFVLNIITDPRERIKAIQNAYYNLKPGGYYLVEVKYRSQEQWQINNAFTAHELDSLIKPHGFRKVRQIFGSRSLAVLYRKELT